MFRDGSPVRVETTRCSRGFVVNIYMHQFTNVNMNWKCFAPVRKVSPNEVFLFTCFVVNLGKLWSWSYWGSAEKNQNTSGTSSDGDVTGKSPGFFGCCHYSLAGIIDLKSTLTDISKP